MKRGEDYFRSAVIEALGDYRAAYAYDVLVEVAMLDGPLQDDAALALGKIGEQAGLDDAGHVTADRPRSSQPTVAAAICLLGVNCGSHQNYLIETLKFADRNLGFQELLRGAAAGLGALAVAGGHDEARRGAVRRRHSGPRRSRHARPSRWHWHGGAAQHAADAVAARTRIRTAIGPSISIAEGFDRLEEDLDKETFFADRAPHLLGLPRGLADAPVDADAHRETGFLMDYRQAGVDIDAGNETVRRIKSLARATFTPGVLSDIGSFGGLFRLDRDRFQEPVLVSSADGVGTKLKVAFMTGRHDTIGADLVNHCINDILVQGAEPLFFLDYLATGRLSPDVAEQVVGGVARACRENGCALIGGETAEMPGFYADGEYDLAGFIVGAVDRAKIVDGRVDRARRRADRVAVRRAAHERLLARAPGVLRRRRADGRQRTCAELGATVGDALLAPHRCYLPVVRPLLERGLVKGLAHITGGGITENLPRILPDGCAAEIDPEAWNVPPLFRFLQERGGIGRDEMYPHVQHGHRSDRRLPRATRPRR